MHVNNWFWDNTVLRRYSILYIVKYYNPFCFLRSRLREIKHTSSHDNESNTAASGKKGSNAGFDNLGMELSVRPPQSVTEKWADYVSKDDPPLAKESDNKGSTAEMEKENEYQ